MGNIVSRVWRGDYHPWFIIIVFQFIIPAIVVMAIALIPHVLEYLETHKPLLYTVRTFYFVYNVWICVGVWRAASDAGVVLGVLAQIFVILAGISIAGQMFSLPQEEIDAKYAVGSISALDYQAMDQKGVQHKYVEDLYHYCMKDGTDEKTKTKCACFANGVVASLTSEEFTVFDGYMRKHTQTLVPDIHEKVSKVATDCGNANR